MPIRAKRWTRAQYERAIDRGVFNEDERIELLDGVLVVKEPQGDRHAAAIDLDRATITAPRRPIRRSLLKSPTVASRSTVIARPPSMPGLVCRTTGS